MIEIQSYRRKGGPEFLTSTRKAEIPQALESLFKYELGFGGSITAVGDDHLEVTTKILHNEDRTVFTGPKEEIEHLQAAALLWARAAKDVSMDEWWKRVSAATDGVPLLVTMSAGIIHGELVKEKLREQIGIK